MTANEWHFVFKRSAFTEMKCQCLFFCIHSVTLEIKKKQAAIEAYLCDYNDASNFYVKNPAYKILLLTFVLPHYTVHIFVIAFLLKNVQ